MKKAKFNLKTEITSVLWSMEHDNSAMKLNRHAIEILIKNGLIQSPYNGKRDDRQIVANVLLQLTNKEKDALNVLPYKYYDSYEAHIKRLDFEKQIGMHKIEDDYQTSSLQRMFGCKISR